MNMLLVYTLKSALVLTLLYLPYTLLLRRERFFRLNRLMLLTILLLALVEPLCGVTLPAGLSRMPVVAGTQELVWQTEAVIVGADASTPSAGMSWASLFSFIYIAGVGLMLCLRAAQLMQIRRALRRGCLWREREDDGVTIWCHVGDGAPFSWMHSIYISADDYAGNGRAILLHERAHIACRHSMDILLLTFVEAVQWWNPFVYRLGRSLRDVHEYEADDRVLRQGVSLSDYQALLVRKVMAGTAYAFANNFNRSHVARRLTMMKRPPSRPLALGKALYVVPLLLFTLVLTAAPVIEPLLFLDDEEISIDRMARLPKDSIDHIDVLRGPTATSLFGERARGGVILIETFSRSTAQQAGEQAGGNAPVFLIAEEMPEFPGGETAMKDYIRRHIGYPAEARAARLHGRMDVRFIVEADGTLTNVRAEYSGDTAEGAEATITGYSPPFTGGDGSASHMRAWLSAAEQLVSQMPRWNPARQQGRPVRAQVTLPLYYKLE